MYWGESNAMKQLRTLIEKVAQTDANILITGENGTGKKCWRGNTRLVQPIPAGYDNSGHGCHHRIPVRKRTVRP